MDKLRTGIVGIGEYGKMVFNAIAKNETLRITAIGDQNRETAGDFAKRSGAAAYDDYRSLIVQEDLDVLFLTLPTFLCGECIKEAAKKKMHIFKEVPLARSLPEATQWVQLVKKAGRRFHIGSAKRFSPAFLEAHRLLEQQRIGQVYLVRAEVFSDLNDKLRWRADPILAGGGVLLEQGYHLIDQILWNMGPPESVYSLNTSVAGQHSIPPSRTEDSAVLNMKFGDNATATLTAAWLTGPQSEHLVFHGTKGTIAVKRNRLRVFEKDGQTIVDENFDVNEQWLIDQQVRHFADSLCDEDIEPISSAGEHLANVAVVESAYLSNRTQMPERLAVYGSAFAIE